MENDGEGDTKLMARFAVCPNGWTMEYLLKRED